jgi:hypothetical protein
MMSWSKALESKRTVIILIFFFDAEGALRSFYTFYWSLKYRSPNINDKGAASDAVSHEQ